MAISHRRAKKWEKYARRQKMLDIDAQCVKKRNKEIKNIEWKLWSKRGRKFIATFDAKKNTKYII